MVYRGKVTLYLMGGVIIIVPFGYERKQQEQSLKNRVEFQQHKRVYLDVTASQTSSGKMIPESFEWEGKTYRIDQILDSQNGQSFKYRTNALRFYCKCRNTKFHLFFEDGGFGNQKFYIELADNQ